MKILTKKDILIVTKASLVADYDVFTLMNLYQPIIGHNAVSLYLSFLTEARNKKTVSTITHGVFLNRVQMTIGGFVETRKLLEGIGLIKTFLKKGDDFNQYRYEIYSPKTPENFFKSSLYFGLLIKAIGETDAYKLKSIYSLENDPKKDQLEQEITSSYNEVFNYDPQNPDGCYLKAVGNKDLMLGRKSSHVKSEFRYDVFFDTIKKNTQFSEMSFTKEEIKEVERKALLFGISEGDMAMIVIPCVDNKRNKGKRIDFELLSKKCQEIGEFTSTKIKSRRVQNGPALISSESDLAKKVNEMEINSPLKYLQSKQNGVKVSPSDAMLINDIITQYQLPFAVINALVDYCLKMNDNILSRRYMEKVASSLVREGVNTALEAIEYLNRIANRRKKEKKEENIAKIKEEHLPEVEAQVQEELPTWDELMEELDRE